MKRGAQVTIRELRNRGGEAIDRVEHGERLKGSTTSTHLWLIGQGLEDRSALSPDVLRDLLVQTLASILDWEGAEDLVEHLQTLGPESEQIELIDGLLRSPDPRTNDVLHANGGHHPAKAVAKAARKAVFRRSSYH